LFLTLFQVDAHFVQSPAPSNASSWKVRPLNPQSRYPFVASNNAASAGLAALLCSIIFRAPPPPSYILRCIFVTFSQVQHSDPASCAAGGVETAFDKVGAPPTTRLQYPQPHALTFSTPAPNCNNSLQFQALLLGERAALPLMRDVTGHMASYDVCGPTDPATSAPSTPQRRQHKTLNPLSKISPDSLRSQL
jgi:hypothetical protein